MKNLQERVATHIFQIACELRVTGYNCDPEKLVNEACKKFSLSDKEALEDENHWLWVLCCEVCEDVKSHYD